VLCPGQAHAAHPDAYREERFDREILNEMGALGLLGPTIPEEYGGAGLGYVPMG